jgi:hypothetical protein
LASPDEAAALGLIDKNNAELHPLPAGFSIKLHPKRAMSHIRRVGGSPPAIEAKEPETVS